MVLGIFPYILAILIAIGLFRNSGALDLIIKPITPVLNTLGVPKEIVPLCILRPLSGGASMSLVMDIFKIMEWILFLENSLYHNGWN